MQAEPVEGHENHEQAKREPALTLNDVLAARAATRGELMEAHHFNMAQAAKVNNTLVRAREEIERLERYASDAARDASVARMAAENGNTGISTLNERVAKLRADVALCIAFVAVFCTFFGGLAAVAIFGGP